ncbi:hypothetical protein EB796_010264 [Bugula neritina]|uniref:Uncharacterized protein n=1 Tax=Bugula neritina TaxID=10212 RepID=A0A7J7K1C9_BUGNE|nr:hypothetical protein EB796_010264 [Bugula neritina]
MVWYNTVPGQRLDLCFYLGKARAELNMCCSSQSSSHFKVIEYRSEVVILGDSLLRRLASHIKNAVISQLVYLGKRKSRSLQLPCSSHMLQTQALVSSV